MHSTQLQAKIQVAINGIAKAHDLPIDDSLSMLMSRAAMAVYEASRLDKSNVGDECRYDHSKLTPYGDPCPVCGIVEGSDMK